MKLILMTIVLSVISNICDAQRRMVYDTSESLYAHVNFGFNDDLNLWQYSFKMWKNRETSSSIATVIFRRTEKILDETNTEFRASGWQPAIGFNIYLLKDSAEARATSDRIRSFAENYPANSRGGDYFIIGQYIFVNNQAYLPCFRNSNATDYCRPTVNRLLGNLNITPGISVEDLLAQLPIRKVKY